MIRRSFGCTALFRATWALRRLATTRSKRWARESLSLEQLEPRLLLAAGVRTKLDNEGYLHFDEDAEIAVIGWERVGGQTTSAN